MEGASLEVQHNVPDAEVPKQVKLDMATNIYACLPQWNRQKWSRVEMGMMPVKRACHDEEPVHEDQLLLADGNICTSQMPCMALCKWVATQIGCW